MSPLDTMTDLTSLHTKTATDALDQVAAGTLTHAAVLEAQLARIAEREPTIHAWAWHDPQQVRNQFSALTAAQRKQPLAGIAIGIKDVIDTADMPTA